MRSAGYLTLCATGLAIALFSIANLSMSLPEDEKGPGVSRATLVRRRLRSRLSHLERRLHSLVSLRRELQDSAAEQQKQAATAAAAAAAAAAASTVLRPRRNHTSIGSAVKARNTEGHAATALASTSAATAAATAAATSSSAAAARRARRGPRRQAPVAASPPPAMGPPLLLRPGKEAACLAHRGTPLEALARATCSLSETRQQFVWEARARN